MRLLVLLLVASACIVQTRANIINQLKDKVDDLKDNLTGSSGEASKNEEVKKEQEKAYRGDILEQVGHSVVDAAVDRLKSELQKKNDNKLGDVALGLAAGKIKNVFHDQINKYADKKEAEKADEKKPESGDQPVPQPSQEPQKVAPVQEEKKDGLAGLVQKIVSRKKRSVRTSEEPEQKPAKKGIKDRLFGLFKHKSKKHETSQSAEPAAAAAAQVKPKAEPEMQKMSEKLIVAQPEAEVLKRVETQRVDAPVKGEKSHANHEHKDLDDEVRKDDKDDDDDHHHESLSAKSETNHAIPKEDNHHQSADDESHPSHETLTGRLSSKNHVARSEDHFDDETETTLTGNNEDHNDHGSMKHVEERDGDEDDHPVHESLARQSSERSDNAGYESETEASDDESADADEDWGRHVQQHEDEDDVPQHHRLKRSTPEVADGIDAADQGKSGKLKRLLRKIRHPLKSIRAAKQPAAQPAARPASQPFAKPIGPEPRPEVAPKKSSYDDDDDLLDYATL